MRIKYIFYICSLKHYIKFTLIYNISDKAVQCVFLQLTLFLTIIHSIM